MVIGGHARDRWVHEKAAAAEADAFDMVELDMFVEGLGAEVAVVNGEAAFSEPCVVVDRTAMIGVFDVVERVDGFGVIDKEGAVGVDDASCSGWKPRTPQLHGADGGTVFQLETSLRVTPLVLVLIRSSVAPDFNARPHINAIIV